MSKIEDFFDHLGCLIGLHVRTIRINKGIRDIDDRLEIVCLNCGKKLKD